MSRALVLNATYEPLSVVSSRRALCLLIAEKAEMIESDDAVFHSESLALASPAVVRLNYMVRAPRRRIASVSRRAVFARDDYRCQYCGSGADSIDHVVPRSRGGLDDWDNLAAACRACNSAKRNRTPAEAGMCLLRPCGAPRATAWTIVGAAGVPDVWKPYLALTG